MSMYLKSSPDIATFAAYTSVRIEFMASPINPRIVCVIIVQTLIDCDAGAKPAVIGLKS